MSVVELPNEDSEFQDSGNQKGGYQNKIAIAFHADVQTWPTFGASAAQGATEADNLLSTTGNIALKTGKRFSKHESFNDKIECETKNIEGSKSYETVVKMTLQKTTRNRAIVDKWIGSRLVLVVFPSEGDPELLGNQKFYVTAMSPSIKGGSQSDANKSIEVEFKFKPDAPVAYPGTVSYTPAV
ncbi:hypothetical protein [Flectobacillus roseus]|uniref:hypothetical protein n=1 Tax=Flectobacillus roseus TaxID=502259 RepID=UPI0024B6D90A|nr:hypothetical protein [Flectobacillus roseus]MDI9870568.1 hypothetical protein [Flectobacillus roseus]